MKSLTLSLPSCGALLTTLKAKLPTKEDQKSPKNKKEEVATKDQQQGIENRVECELNFF